MDLSEKCHFIQNSRPRPSRAAAVAANAAVSAANSNEALVLDPVTGEYMSGNSYYDNGGNYGSANDVHMVNAKQAFMNHGQLKHSKSSLQVCVWSLVIFLSLFNTLTF